MVAFGKRETLTESVNTVLIKHENYTLSTSYKYLESYSFCDSMSGFHLACLQG